MKLFFALIRGWPNWKMLKELLRKETKRVEIVLTGRGATAELIDLADLVTEVKSIKHPFDKGVKGP